MPSPTPAAAAAAAAAAADPAAAAAAGLEPGSPEAKAAVRTLLWAVFLDLLAVALVIPLMPQYAKRAGIDPAMYGVLSSLYGVGQLAGAPMMGQVSDRFGRRTVLLVSAAGTAVSYLTMGYAASVPVLFLSRLPVGVVKQTSAAAQAYMTDVTGIAERNKMLGRVETAISVAFVIGPVCGGLLSRVAVEVPAVASALLLAAECAVVYAWLPEPRHRQGGVAAACPASGATAADGQGDGDGDDGEVVRCPATGQPAAKLGGGAAGMWRGVTAAFREPAVAPLMWTALLLMLGTVLNQTTMLLSLQARYDLTPQKNGMVLGYVGLLNSLVQGLAIAPLTHRFSDRRLTVLSLMCMGLALVASWRAPTFGAWMAVQPLVVAGKAVARTTVTASATKAVDHSRVGAVLGTIALFSSVSRIVAPLLGGLLQSRFGHASVDAVVGLAMLGLATMLAGRAKAAPVHPKSG